MRVLLRVSVIFVVCIVLAVVVAAVAVYAVSESRLNRQVSVPTETVTVPTDAAAIQRGQHLASAVAACVDCHRPDLSGKILVDDPGLGRVSPANLTRGSGGIGATFSDADYVRAIRQGLDPSGKPLLIMPASDYWHFSDADLGAIIAYIRSVPPVDNTLPPNELRALGRVLFATGQLKIVPADDIDHAAPRPGTPPAGVTPEYGLYLAQNAGCPTCHGPGLSGGKIAAAPPDALPAPNISPSGIGSWSEADFVKALRTGTRPDGHVLDTFMPWPYFAQMTDDELSAIWRYVQSVPPRPAGTH